MEQSGNERFLPAARSGRFLSRDVWNRKRQPAAVDALRRKNGCLVSLSFTTRSKVLDQDTIYVLNGDIATVAFNAPLWPLWLE